MTLLLAAKVLEEQCVLQNIEKDHGGDSKKVQLI